jgi:hypothetical protein
MSVSRKLTLPDRAGSHSAGKRAGTRAASPQSPGTGTGEPACADRLAGVYHDEP